MKRVTCTGCSLLCDDVIVGTDGLFIDKVYGACLKGKERFDQITAPNRITSPMIRKNSNLENVSWDDALNRVEEIIKNSSKPLLYGFSTCNCEAQLKAIKLAKKINGYIDSNSSICQGKVLNIAAETGITLTTVGEIINKADFIVLWGANAAESIPRLLNKLVFSRGKFRMTGREIKTVAIIDPVKTASFGVFQIRDIAMQIEANKDLELIKALKDACCSNDGLTKDKVAGIDNDELKRFFMNLIGAENGVIILGQGILRPDSNANLIKEILELVQMINLKQKKGRISLILLGGHFNMIGFEQVALSVTGKNQALQFSDNKLSSNENSIISKIQNDDFDCSIILGTDPISHLPFELSKKLASKPIITIDNRKSATTHIADIVLPTAITGIEVGGLVYRLDQVPIELDKILDPPSGIPSDEELLEKIIQKLI
ncbi:MAG: formylmethanofuran dehydrogenase subunit B [Candidatus Hermodarchaeota archaeon]